MSWEMPYRACRSPVCADNVVAASQPLATMAGIAALRDGGNAVDAALAAAITLTVVEPSGCGIGGDAFAMVYDGDALHGLNASGRAPRGLDTAKFAGMTAMPQRGWDAVTVPGAVSAWVALSERFGALPFACLFDDATHYACAGFPVGPKTAAAWRQAAAAFKDYQPFMDTFTIRGRAPAAGEKMRLPDHAKTLAKIADSGGAGFYHGELAQAIAADAAEHGAAMTADDLAEHRCEWVSPVHTDAFGAALHEIPPNGQGLMALVALGIAARAGLAEMQIDSADSVHTQLEAMRIAYADMERHLADLSAMRVAPRDFLQDDYLSRRAGEINPARANPRPYAYQAGADTVYLAAADANGMMVSFIQSNYKGFGSGVVVPGTGISMHNRGAGFVLEPGHPNQIAPGKRPYHTIIPAFVTRDNAPLMCFGVMGAHMQPQGHLQMFARVVLHGQNPQAASDAPRWHLFQDGRVALEHGFDETVITELQNRGHPITLGEPQTLFGGAQLIAKTDHGYVAGSDHRKEGMAAGF